MMGQLADGLTAVGNHYALLLVGMVELLVAVMFLLGRVLRRIQKKTKINKGEMKTQLLHELDEWEKEAYVLFRRSDMMPVYGTGNLSAILGVSLQELQEDVANLKKACKNQEMMEKLWRKYQAWDGEKLLEKQVPLNNGQWVQITIKRSSTGVYDQFSFYIITEIHQKIDEYEHRLSEAEEESKSKTTFLSRMSHEIRTPINGILGMLQLTLMADDLQADYRDNLLTAKGCADNLLRLINDILDISKLEAGKYNLKEEIFDVRAAIEETVAAQVPTATNKGLALDCTFGNNIPKLVKGDGQRIQQILNCLLSNALKFTSEGSVRVKIAAIDAEKENINLRIAVADTGIGISEKNMDKLFIRFSQVDASDTRKYGGSGLGLVISKQIAELMGGNISVQSKEGIGSTFIAEIPLKVVKAAEVEAAREVEEKEDAAVFSINAHSKARILVAEDEPVNQQVIGKLLGMAGFSYDIAENGEKAIELFKQKEYDAALFDVQMPVMDGIAATQQIREIEMREHRKRLPIIAVTARAMFGDKERILENKLDDYIAKPYNLNTVVETLNRYIDKKED